MQTNTENTTNTLIASEQFLHHLGLKTLLSVIGVETNLLEATGADEMNRLLQSMKDIDFIIVTEKILKQCTPNHFAQKCPHCKLLVVGKKTSEIPNCQFINQSAEQKQVLEKFQNFFFEPDPSEEEEESYLLSDRETEVLKTVALGLSNKEIADHLCISINTVISHRKNITSKLGIKTISGLTVYALLNHIIQPEEVM